jgi:hypothetical protein
MPVPVGEKHEHVGKKIKRLMEIFSSKTRNRKKNNSPQSKKNAIFATSIFRVP